MDIIEFFTLEGFMKFLLSRRYDMFPESIIPARPIIHFHNGSMGEGEDEVDDEEETYVWTIAEVCNKPMLLIVEAPSLKVVKAFSFGEFTVIPAKFEMHEE